MKKTLIVVAVLAATGLVRADVSSINSTNMVGYVAVANSVNQTNTIITVPFEGCLSNGAAGFLADLVSTSGLTAASNPAQADQLVVLTTDTHGLVYYYYWLQAGQGWTATNTETVLPGGTNNITSVTTNANVFQISRGLGFWVKRVNPSANNAPVFVQGQVSTNIQSITVKPGLNLVGFASPGSFSLNDFTWNGVYAPTSKVNTASNDHIMVVLPGGIVTNYFYFKQPPGIAWAKAAYSNANNKWIDANFNPETDKIPAGQGFWYLRRGGTTNLTLQ